MGAHRVSQDILRVAALGSLIVGLAGCGGGQGAANCAAPSASTFEQRVALHGVTCNDSCKVSIAFGTTKLTEAGTQEKPLLHVEQEIDSGSCTTKTKTDIDRASLVRAEIQVEPLLWSEYEALRRFHACAQRPLPDFPAVYVTNVSTTRSETGSGTCPVRFPAEHGSALVVPFETVEEARKWADDLESMRCADAVKLTDPCEVAKLAANCPNVMDANLTCPELADLTQTCNAANDDAFKSHRTALGGASASPTPPNPSPKRKKK